MNSYKLSFCIPTYNRASFIGETLDSIISQATEDIEVVVLDGGSPDNTEEVIKEYQDRFPRLRYFRQDFKGGVDQDISRVVEMGEGEYCWIMPDDDILKPGAVKTVLSQLDNDYDLIVVNGEMRNADFSEVLEPKRLLFETDRIYNAKDHDNLFIDAAFYLTFTGAIVIKRSCWNSREKEKYFGSRFVEVGVIFQRELSGGALIIADPLVLIRYGNAEWAPKAFEIWMFKWPELVWSFPNFLETVKEKVCPREPWRSMKNLVQYRAKGRYSIDEYRKWLKNRFSSRLQRFGAKLIALCPGLMMNSLVIAYVSFFYPNAKGMLLDFKNSRFYWKNLFH